MRVGDVPVTPEETAADTCPATPLGPRGLGLWVAFPNANTFKDLRGAAQRARSLHVKWVAVHSGQSQRALSPPALHDWLSEFDAEGIEVYTWNYSVPGQVAAQVAQISALVTEGVAGHILDAEGEWGSSVARRDTSAEALQLGAALREKIGAGTYLAHAPFAYERSHEDFPYAAFGSFTDAVHPQIYHCEFGVPYETAVTRTDADWAAFDAKHPASARPICPIGNSYGRGTPYGKPPGVLREEDVTAFLERYKSRPCMSLYSWEAAQEPAWAAIAARLG